MTRTNLFLAILLVNCNASLSSNLAGTWRDAAGSTLTILSDGTAAYGHIPVELVGDALNDFSIVADSTALCASCYLTTSNSADADSSAQSAIQCRLSSPPDLQSAGVGFMTNVCQFTCEDGACTGAPTNDAGSHD